MMSPADYGIVNQVLSLGSIYILLLTFALDETAARYYFLYRNNNEKPYVLGTIITFSFIVSVVGSLILLLFHKISYRFLIPDIPMLYIVLSLLVVLLSPTIAIYQKLLRIK